MKKVIVLSFCLCVCASVVANSACNDPLGWLVPEDVKCNCAHPIIDFKTMRVSCQPTYCPEGTECMENGYCCDGKVVDNYVNGKGIEGQVCCPVKADYADGVGSHGNALYFSGYTVAGAVDGVCCAGFTSTSVYDDHYGTIRNSSSIDYEVYENGGVYFCGRSDTTTDYDISITHWDRYVSAGKYCSTIGGSSCYGCMCSDSGDPAHLGDYNCPCP